MKRFLTVLTALVVAVGALVQCKPYDDAWIKEELADLKAQVANLQSSVNALDAYKTLLDKSRLISEVKDHGNGTFTIYFADGTAPVSLVAGQGPKGEDGTDGVTPDFKIEDGDWYVTYDEGTTWTKIGSASSGETFFQNVTLDGDFLVLVLIDGTEVRINLKGGSGGDEPGGDEPGGDDKPKATLEDWLGNWKYDNTFDVLLTEADGKVYLNWKDDNGVYVQVPFTFDAETGNLLLYMPQYRGLGGNQEVAYYLNLYTPENKRLSPDPADGSLILTASLDEGGESASFTAADANYSYFYARPYDYTTSKWGSSKFYMYCTGESSMTKVAGGDDDPGVTYAVTADFKFQYYNAWFYVNKAAGNYAFWTVPVSGGDLSDEAFVKATLDEFGAKLAAGSDGSVDATTATNTKKWQIFSGQARYTTAPYYCSSGAADADHNYYVFMAGVSVDGGVKLTGDYAVITITWN